MENIQVIETWKDIPSYQGLYQASDKGRIRRIKGRSCLTDRLVKQFKNSRGYFKVILSKDDTAKNHLVHRLVAEAFLPNPNNYEVVNHINMDQEDNNMTNLEWCTQKMNLQPSKTKRGLKKVIPKMKIG